MTNVHGDLDEMNTLKEDVQKLGKKQKRSRPADAQEADKAEKRERSSHFTRTHPAGEEVSESDDTILDLTDHIESFAREMEKGAKDHPTLALFGAFVLGVVVGQLFSRR